VALFTFLVGIPSALSQGASEFFSNIELLPQRLSNVDFLSHMSFIFGDFSLAFGALLLSIFIGWIWGAKNASNELTLGNSKFYKWAKFWGIMIRFLCPSVIFIILLNLFLQF
jgi:NSS family neurotransmitter:Na+ symporter